MISWFISFFNSKKQYKDIAPDEIFLDSQNLPDFDVHQFEGRIEKPISKWSLTLLSSLFIIVSSIFIYKLWVLQVAESSRYAVKSENNRLADT